MPRQRIPATETLESRRAHHGAGRRPAAARRWAWLAQRRHRARDATPLSQFHHRSGSAAGCRGPGCWRSCSGAGRASRGIAEALSARSVWPGRLHPWAACCSPGCTSSTFRPICSRAQPPARSRPRGAFGWLWPARAGLTAGDSGAFATRRAGRLLNWWALVFVVALIIWLLIRFRPYPYLEIWHFISDGIVVTLRIVVISFGFILLVSLLGGLGRISHNTHHLWHRVAVCRDRPRHPVAGAVAVHLVCPAAGVSTPSAKPCCNLPPQFSGWRPVVERPAAEPVHSGRAGLDDLLWRLWLRDLSRRHLLDPPRPDGGRALAGHELVSRPCATSCCRRRCA